MTVMNDNEKRTGPVEDHRSKPRWSANKEMDAVLRLLRGEPLDELSRELEVEAHRLAAWREEFLEHAEQGLKAARADRGDPAELRPTRSRSPRRRWSGPRRGWVQLGGVACSLGHSVVFDIGQESAQLRMVFSADLKCLQEPPAAAVERDHRD